VTIDSEMTADVQLITQIGETERRLRDSRIVSLMLDEEEAILRLLLTNQLVIMRALLQHE
jgi:hypothetical protein